MFTTSSAGGISDIFMRVLGEALQQAPRPAADHREPSRRRRQHRRARLRRGAARRLHHLHHQCRSADLQPVPVQEAAVRSGEGSTPIVNLFHLIQVLVVNSDLKVKTVDELVAVSKAKPGTLNYLTASMPLAVLHGQPQARQGRRLGARAVQGRRRGDQRHPRRHDADRPDRARQRDRRRSRPAR